jgi:uncharacterized protein YdeI (YjbR/CyaY-like superfamily)
MKTTPQSVDAFLAALAHPQTALINALRRLVQSSAPSLVEGIKWKAPSYALNGNDIVTFNFRNYQGLSLIFHTGPKGKDTHSGVHPLIDDFDMLQWVADKRAVLRIQDRQTFEENTMKIGHIIRTWVDLAHNNFEQ